jgi:hypothetical protein
VTARPVIGERDQQRLLSLARRQPETAGRLGDLLGKLEQRAVEAALAHPDVAARLEGARFRTIGADLRGEKGEQEASRLVEVGFYDYDREVLVVAVMAVRSGELVALEERSVQPALVEDEVDEATELMLTDERFTALARRRERLQPVAFLAQRLEPGENRRLIELHLWTSGRRPRPVASALVDLSRGEVSPYVSPDEPEP